MRHDVQGDYLMHTYGRLPVTFASGLGAELLDVHGREYLDFLSGVGTVCLGHCNPEIVRALRHQAGRLWQTSNYFIVERSQELAKRISDLLSATTDEEGRITGATETRWQTFFCNSGAEANEGAIKVARKWGKENGEGSGIITLKESYHGQTLATLSASGRTELHDPYLPLTPGFDYVDMNDVDQLEEALKHPREKTGPVCAIMIECIQGEAGVRVADLDYIRAAARLCEETNTLLIVDEVETGIFRTGAPFAFQEAGIEPDIVSMSKGLGSGFPIGATSATSKIAKVMQPGDHSSTFGGSALACAVGNAVLETLVAEDYNFKVIERGAHLREVLDGLPHVKEVRGRGLMWGVELDKPIAMEVVERCLGEGLVINSVGDSVLRILPPFTIFDDQTDAMGGKLAAAIEAVALDS